MSVPRKKPWEVSSGTSAAAVSGGETAPQSMPNLASDFSSTNTQNAGIPDRPQSLTSDLSSMANTSPYGNSTGSYGGYGNRYGSTYGSGYGGGYGSYGSGYGSSMYGTGYGGYGSSMYGMGGMGGMGGGMYGMGGYGGGMYGQPGMAGGLGEGTQATFQLIESIIGAVGGFAQMLEATYMATHSSFFTMVSLAEQFGNLKNALGSLLGIFALINFVKKIFRKITGKPYNYGLNMKEFAKFENKQKKLEDKVRRQASGAPSRISLKPLLLFLAASIGFPYLLSKAIKKINEQQQRRNLGHQQELPQNFDPSNLQFAKALYEFNPENPNMELELKPNDLVAILSKLDPLGNESKWWKVRSRSGKIGYVPSNYLSIIERSRDKMIIPSSLAEQGVSQLQHQSSASPSVNGPLPEKMVDEFKKFQS